MFLETVCFFDALCCIDTGGSCVNSFSNETFSHRERQFSACIVVFGTLTTPSPGGYCSGVVHDHTATYLWERIVDVWLKLMLEALLEKYHNLAVIKRALLRIRSKIPGLIGDRLL